MKGKNNTIVFLWTNTPEGWNGCLEQIKSFVDENIPAHQYLSHEGIDDALIEVAYLESD